MRILPELIPSDLLMKNGPLSLQKLAIVGTMSIVFLAGCGGATISNNPPTTLTQSTTSSPTPSPTSPPAHFTAVGSMTTARAKHTTTLLPSGKVLIAGGSDGMQPLASAELYDSATKTFTPAGDMTAARTGHTATLLPNGKVLIAGGSDGSQPLASAELYDPTTGMFVPTGSMTTAGVAVSAAADSVVPAVLLATGKVLFAGGNAELYDPATGTFALAGPYADTVPVSWDTATLLLDGRVLLTGAAFRVNGGPVAGAAELFDPQSGTFSITGPRSEIELSTATLLTDGTVLVVTASFDFSTDDAAIYDPASGKFTHIGQTIGYHGYSAAVRLADGSVLISGGEAIGGSGSSSAELYLPSTRSFVSAGDMATGRQMHTATLFPDGTVLIAGGLSIWALPTPGMTSTAEIYSP